MHVRFKVTWNGFDTSSTNGTFNMYFQGYYNDGSTTNWWTPLGSKASNVKNLKDLVLSSTTGEYIYDFIYYNVPYTTYEGYRANYSNGTGTISFSDFIVIPEKYYIPKTFTGGVLLLFTSEKIIFQQEKYTKSKLPKGGDLE